MAIKHLLVGAVILSGIYVYSQHADAQKYAEMAEAFELSEAQAGVMRACRGSLSRHDRDFREQVGEFRGCACVAKRLTKDVPTQNYAAASRVVDIIIAGSKSAKRSAYLKRLETDKKLSGLPPVERYRIVMNATSAIGYCGRAKNHARRAVADVKLPKLD